MVNPIRGPYEISALTYYEAGFSPIPAMGKLLVVKEASGRYPVASREKIEKWSRTHGPFNVALRLPYNALAFDVDSYKGDISKLRELEESLGKLPPTWNSDSRGGDGGKVIYRIPDKFSSDKWLSNINGITIVQHTHRYVMAFPSYNKESDSRYLWYYGLGGLLVPDQQIPSVDSLTELPENWAIALRKQGNLIFNQTEIYNIGLDDFNAEAPCQYMQTLTQICKEKLLAAYDGGLHDAGTSVMGTIVKAASFGHPGVTEALEELAIVFCSAPRTRDLGAEWNNALPYILAPTEIVSIVDTCDMKLILTEEEMRRKIFDDSEINKLLDTGKNSESRAVELADMSPTAKLRAKARLGKTYDTQR